MQTARRLDVSFVSGVGRGVLLAVPIGFPHLVLTGPSDLANAFAALGARVPAGHHLERTHGRGSTP